MSDEQGKIDPRKQKRMERVGLQTYSEERLSEANQTELQPLLDHLLSGLGDDLISIATENNFTLKIDDREHKKPALLVGFPQFGKKQDTNSHRDRILDTLAAWSNELLDHKSRFNAIAKNPSASMLKPTQPTVHQQQAVPFHIPVTELNGKSDLGEFITDLRRCAGLQAFKEADALGDIRVRINEVKGGELSLFIEIPDAKKHTASLKQLDQTRHILSLLHHRWEENGSMQKAKVVKAIKEVIEGLPSAGVREDFTPTPENQPIEAEHSSMKLNFTGAANIIRPCPIQFTLPEFNEQGQFVIGSSMFDVTPNQKNQINTIATKDIALIHGPAGTGKTFWSCYMALKGLKEGRYHKISFAAPTVETEDLGFRPGSEMEKASRFVNQILDHFDDLLGNGNSDKGRVIREKLLKAGLVELKLLGNNRGNNFPQTCYIIDECQNATWDQLKTAAERIKITPEAPSTFIFMGDERQNDTKGKSPYFAAFMERLSHPSYAPFVGTVKLGAEDIKRHPFVKLFIERCDDLPPDANEIGKLQEKLKTRYQRSASGESIQNRTAMPEQNNDKTRNVIAELSPHTFR